MVTTTPLFSNRCMTQPCAQTRRHNHAKNQRKNTNAESRGIRTPETARRQAFPPRGHNQCLSGVALTQLSNVPGPLPPPATPGRVTGTGTRRSLSRQAAPPQKHPQPWRSRTAPKKLPRRPAPAAVLCGCQRHIFLSPRVARVHAQKGVTAGACPCVLSVRTARPAPARCVTVHTRGRGGGICWLPGIS